MAGKGLHGQLKSRNAEFVFFLEVKRRQGLFYSDLLDLNPLPYPFLRASQSTAGPLGNMALE